MKKALFFCTGFICGLIVLSLFIILSKDYDYYKLKKDYYISDVGIIKSGTLIKADKRMSEGFTTYILYLNLHDSEVTEMYHPTVEEKSVEKFDIIIPYWLYPKVEQ